MDVKELMLHDLFSVSDFGTMQGICDELQKINRKNKGEFEGDQEEFGHLRPLPRYRKGVRGTPPIVVPDEDVLYRTSRGRGRTFQGNPARSEDEAFTFDYTTRELKEIQSAGLRNENIENYIQSLVEKEEMKAEYLNCLYDSDQNDDVHVKKEKQNNSENHNAEKPGDADATAKSPSKKKRKDRKAKNALLNSLNKNKMGSQKNEIKIEETPAKPSDHEIESSHNGSDFIVDDSVDKLDVDEKLLSQLLHNVKVDDSLESSIETAPGPFTDETSSDDDFFSASGLSSSSLEYATASSRKSTPVDPSLKSRRKKGYHRTSRRGLPYGENSIGFILGPSGGKKSGKEKVKKLVAQPQEDYHYEPSEVMDFSYTYRENEFPPLKSP